jgi:apolipoprotein N-acyltransferase
VDLAEWLRGTLFTGFPWLAVGYAQSPPSPLAGWASVLGVYGVGFIVALIGALLGQMRLRLAPAGPWIAILLLLGFGALLRAMDWTQPHRLPRHRQPAAGQRAAKPEVGPEAPAAVVDTYLKLARAHPATLTVLPETAIPLYFNEVPREVLRGLTGHGDALIGVAIGTATAATPMAPSP